MSAREGMELFPSRLRTPTRSRGAVRASRARCLLGFFLYLKVRSAICSPPCDETKLERLKSQFESVFSFPGDSLQWTREERWYVNLPRAASDKTAAKFVVWDNFILIYCYSYDKILFKKSILFNCN